MPVSYTHLDVYKRQGTACCPPGLRSLGTVPCRWGPVSYTHLDVYKRQVYEQDDGTQTPVDVDLQIQKLGTLTRAAGGGTLYEVKASTKKEEGSAGGGRKVQANATLYWIDNLGPVNELYRVKGEWINSLYDTANPESAGVLYGEFPANVPGDSCVAKHPNAMSFDYYADDITGYTLGVQTSIKCEKNGILYLIVTSSIFS